MPTKPSSLSENAYPRAVFLGELAEQAGLFRPEQGSACTGLLHCCASVRLLRVPVQPSLSNALPCGGQMPRPSCHASDLESQASAPASIPCATSSSRFIVAATRPFGFPTLQEDVEYGQPLPASTTGWRFTTGNPSALHGNEMQHGKEQQKMQ
ncbi:uncharacterized protein [Dermacentor albipictus]|uniref:uncharacterized protein n=1 Tax=Dermacentor albipictus TaxID=60249 RepID=UPI0038FCECD9